MAIETNLSLMGMYDYDPHILDGLLDNLPDPSLIPKTELYLEGDAIDREAFINILLIECAELEMALPNYDICKVIVKNWAQLNRHKWQLLYNTMYYKYNPIWNKDGRITHTETIERKGERSGKVTDTGSSGSNQSSKRELTDTETHTLESTTTGSGSVNSTATHQVAGFNGETFANSTKDITESTETSNSSGTEGGAITRNGTGGVNVTNTGSSSNVRDSGENSSEKVTTIREDIETGNIGVTMTQQMISAEREVVRYNVIETIIADFKQKFCILVY